MGGVNSDRSQRFATEELDLELLEHVFFRPSGLRRSDPDRDLTSDFQSKSFQ